VKLLLPILITLSLQLNAQTPLSGNWQFRKTGDKKWLPASVPGTVHTDLLANKKIPDPFYRDNEPTVKWIEQADWEYQLRFSIDETTTGKEHIELVFEGLDTYADIFLNDEKILHSNNMFREWRIDIKSKLKKENTLRIFFHAAVAHDDSLAKAQLPRILPGENSRMYSRKAQYQYGWDWGPRLVTAGIWKPVRLHTWNDARIRQTNIRTSMLNDTMAKVTAIIEVISDKDQTLLLHSVIAEAKKLTAPAIYDSIDATVYIKAMKNQPIELHKGSNTALVEFEVQHPKLWWSNGLGEAFLYTLQTTISGNNLSIDRRGTNFGIRTIELVEEEDESGSTFYFKLNGRKVFMKGANYIPSESFQPRMNADRYNQLIGDARAASMNMLRVWGGGIYEDERFYDACDRNGILIWQDMMFAGAMYPGDTAFTENIRQEIKETVQRLNPHPSVAFYCGNNEIDEAWHNWGWQQQFKLSSRDSALIWQHYRQLFHQVIPETIAKYDPDRSYRPSSPKNGWGRKESMKEGDAHYWGVWWGLEPVEKYQEKVPRFMSEYGMQAMPSWQTILQYSREKDRDTSSLVMKVHQKHPTGYRNLAVYMNRKFKPASNFYNYIYLSQLTQADAMRVAIEAHRKNMPYCMGTLYWQLNDCWPVASWSSIDYYGNWKASHYAMRDLYKTIALSVDKEEKSYVVNIVSDSSEDFKGKLMAEIVDFYGEDPGELFIPTKPITVKANAVTRYKLPAERINRFDSSRFMLRLWLVADTIELTHYNHFLTDPKNLQLPDAKLHIKRINEQEIEISTDKLARFVYIVLPEKEDKVDDNFFDLLPGETRRIHINHPINKKTIKKIKLSSLINTYQP
jgi:beta-mannosidase